MNLVLASTDDIAALHRLIESAYRGDSARQGWTHEADLLGGQRTDRDALRTIISSDDQVILLHKSGDRVIGCVQLARTGDGQAYLGMLTVDPGLQAKGLGKQLLSGSEQYVRDQWQSRNIEMTVIRQRSDLIAYYERRGYVPTGEYRPFPLDDPRFGRAKTDALEFIVLRKPL